MAHVDQTSDGRQREAVRSEASAELSFEQTVPRTLAHRAALGEVFVADSVAVDSGEFLVAVQVPRAHSVWFDRGVPYHDPLATAEAVRQGVFVVIHRHGGLARDLSFSLQRFEFWVHDVDAYKDNQRSPLEGILQLRLRRRDRRRSGLGSLTFEGLLTIDGARAMTAEGYAVFLPHTDFSALRDRQRAGEPARNAGRSCLPQPIDPSRVGRFDRRNVAIGEAMTDVPGESRYELVVDRAHPSFFDHQYDHVPGPLIAEAYRQASIVTAFRAGAIATPFVCVTHCKATFSRFAELDERLVCSVSLNGATNGARDRVALVTGLHQFGRQIADGEVELCTYPSAGAKGRDRREL